MSKYLSFMVPKYMRLYLAERKDASRARHVSDVIREVIDEFLEHQAPRLKEGMGPEKMGIRISEDQVARWLELAGAKDMHDFRLGDTLRAAIAYDMGRASKGRKR